jgi:hypothetical protein
MYTLARFEPTIFRSGGWDDDHNKYLKYSSSWNGRKRVLKCCEFSRQFIYYPGPCQLRQKKIQFASNKKEFQRPVHARTGKYWHKLVLKLFFYGEQFLPQAT